MANLSNFAQVIYLERFPKLDTTAHASPTTFYACLCASLPTVAQTGVTIPELTNAGGYQRTPITFGNAPTGATPTTIANSAVVTFPASTGAYSAAATHFAVCDNTNIAAGNHYYFGALKGTNSVHTLVTGAGTITGTFILTVDGTNTAAIPVGTTGAGLLEYIEGLQLASVPVGSVTVTPAATVFSTASTTWTVTFLDNNIVGQTHTLTVNTAPTGATLTAANTVAGAPGTITVSGANQTPSIPSGNLTVQMS